MTIVKAINILLVEILLLLLRKLVWCLRWLWCYYHGRKVPDPISFLPQQSGNVFEGHLRSKKDDGEES